MAFIKSLEETQLSILDLPAGEYSLRILAYWLTQYSRTGIRLMIYEWLLIVRGAGCRGQDRNT